MRSSLHVLIKQLIVTFLSIALEEAAERGHIIYCPGVTFLCQMGRWPVLHDRPTVASLHRSVSAPHRATPHDSLDLHLISCYQHNREIFPITSDVIRHPARLQDLTQSSSTSESPRDDGEHEQSIVYGGLKQRPSIHSVKLGIGANHIAQTNAGFSRKLDGTFYSL